MLFAGNISNGKLTAGQGGPAELFLHQQTGILSADVVDNGAGGPVSLVISKRSFGTRLQGNNSYSGGTWILGDGSSTTGVTSVESARALPGNERVHVVGGFYSLDFPGVARFAELHLQEFGRVEGFAKVDADNMHFESGIFVAELQGDGTIFKDTLGDVRFVPRSPGFTGDVIVRDGRLTLPDDHLPNAKFRLEGGHLDFEDQGSRKSPDLVLAGGAVSGYHLRGDVEVESDSTLFAYGYTTLYGSIQGAGDLTIRGRLADNYYEKFVGIFGDASQFEGDFNIESGALRIGTPAELGGGAIRATPGTRLMLGANSKELPATRIANDIHLESATLISSVVGWREERSPGIVDGNVFVRSEAFIGATSIGQSGAELLPGMLLSGQMHLEDGVRVYSLGEKEAGQALIEVSGTIETGSNAAWYLRSADVDITGTIRSASDFGSIDFVGSESALDLSRATFQVSNGKKLEVLVNGTGRSFDLAGIAGAGELANDFVLSKQARIAPGAEDGIGELRVSGNVTLGEGASYEWNVDKAAGLPGEDWDLLNVAGELVFAASGGNPWTIKVLPDASVFDLTGASWILGTANSVVGFDPSAVQVDITQLQEAWPSLLAEQFPITQTDSSVLLSFVGILADCDQSGSLNPSDLSCVASIPERDRVLEALNTVAGDLDGNGAVEFADFLKLSANFGLAEASYTQGNVDLAEGVGFSDFLIVSGNFGLTEAARIVPEPSSFFGASVAVLVSICWTRKRRMLNATQS